MGVIMVTNCPNCGATITGDKCEFCGTVLISNRDELLKRQEELKQEQFNLNMQIWFAENNIRCQQIVNQILLDKTIKRFLKSDVYGNRN